MILPNKDLSAFKIIDRSFVFHLFLLIQVAECFKFVGLQRVMEFSDLRSPLNLLFFKLCATPFTDHMCCLQVCSNLSGGSLCI